MPSPMDTMSRISAGDTLAQVCIVRATSAPETVGKRPRFLTFKKTLYWLSFLAGVYLLLVGWGIWCLAWPHPQARFRPGFVGALAGLTLALGVALGLFRAVWADAASRRRFLFAHLLTGFILTSVALLVRLGGLATAPAWPQRDLRAALVVSRASAPGLLPAGAETFDDYNTWGMRDLERTVRKPAGKYRVVCIGDSFLEGGFTSFPVPLLTEKLLAERGIDDVECVNLGISATDPMHYYHRLRHVGLHLQPDAVFLFLYAGNDYFQPDQKFRMDGRELVTCFVDELPKPSLLGYYCPELAWLLSNRLTLSAPAKASVGQTDEFQLMQEWTALPYEVGVRRLAQYMHQTHFPAYGYDQVEAVLTRGGPAFWASLEKRPKDREYLQGWLVKNLLACELQRGWHPTSTAADQNPTLLKSVAATASWLLGMNDLCRTAGIPLVVALCPGGGVDPEFMAYWSPWPIYRSTNFLFEARQIEMSRQLREKSMDHVDLAEVLQGVNGVYRKTDAHWNERGHQLVAQRIAQEIQAVRSRVK